MNYRFRSIHILLAFIFTGVGLVILIATVVVAPSVREITGLEREIIQLRAIAVARVERATQVRMSLRHMAQVRRVVDEISDIFLVGGREIEYIERIEEIADSSGVRQIIRLDAREEGVGIPLAISITARAPFPALVKFLYMLERGAVLLQIDEITMSASQSQPLGGAPEVTATIHAKFKTLAP